MAATAAAPARFERRHITALPGGRCRVRVARTAAEVEALRSAGVSSGGARGATLYVTLEPCCTHGRTPPCTDAILRAGIARVFYAAAEKVLVD